MSTENSTLPVNVQEFTTVMQSAPDVLAKNETSVSKCNAAGQSLIDTIEGFGGINSDELDQAVAEYIKKTKTTVENMNTRRKPLTQLLTAISKSFTSLESAIDIKASGTIPYKLQDARNKYAEKKIKEQKEREEAARRVQALETEKASYRSDLTILLDGFYSKYVEKHISYLNGVYERVDLSNYNEKFKELKEASAVFSWADFVQGVKDNITTFYLGAEDRTTIKNDVATGKKKEYAERYRFEIEELVYSLVERMPSKRKALEEEAVLKQQDAEAAAKAENERKQREADEAAKAEAERRQQEELAKQKAEAEKQANDAQAAFNFMSATMPDAPVKAKVQKKIKVNSPKGFMEIYQLWFIKEGFNLTMDELEKAHKKMITFCEKEANRDGGETIKSALVEYVDDVKAK